MRKGSIYKITCVCTEKVYIGQTVQQPPIKRWLDHYKEIKRSELYLYRAIRYWGIINFTFQILEQDIDVNNLNSREQMWIEKYKADDMEFGYNLTRGGVSTVKSIIDEKIAKSIISDIKTRKEMTFVELAELYKVSKEIISDINCGETWYFVDESYPIRDNSKMKNILTTEDVYDIYDLLRNKVPLTDIAKQYGVSVTNISNINQGKTYKNLEINNYPIYTPVNSKKWLNEDKVLETINLLKTTDYIYSKIGDNVGIGRKTVGGINNGTLYRKISEQLGVLKYPIR